MISEFNRTIITNSIKRKSVDDCNLINCHNLSENSILMLVSSNFNKGYDK